MKSIIKEDKWLLNFCYALIILTLSVFIYGLLYNVRGVLSVLTHAQNNSFRTALSLSSSSIAIALGLVYIRYIKISNVHKIFNISITVLTLFFFVFAFVLYPNIEYLHFKTSYALKYSGASGYIAMIENWTYSLFHIFTKLWSVLITMFFWQACNQTFSVAQAKKVYPFLIVLSSTSIPVDSYVLNVVSIIHSNKIDLGITLKYFSACTIASALIIAWCYGRLLKHAASYEDSEDRNWCNMSKIIRNLFASKHIVYIAIFVLCYAVSNKLTMTLIGLNSHSHSSIALTILFLVTSLIILRIVRWRIAALLPPIALIITITYGLTVYEIYLFAIGFIVFGVTKEILYIPLESNLKLKGKIIVDVIVLQLLGMSMHAMPASIMQFSPFILAGVVIIWIAAIWVYDAKVSST